MPLRALHADGGPTASKFLMQICADLAGVELRVSTMPDCSPLGAMLAAQLGLGRHRSLDSLANSPRDELTYHPAANHERMQTASAGWQRAVAQLLSAQPNASS